MAVPLRVIFGGGSLVDDDIERRLVLRWCHRRCFFGFDNHKFDCPIFFKLQLFAESNNYYLATKLRTEVNVRWGSNLSWRPSSQGKETVTELCIYVRVKYVPVYLVFRVALAFA